MEYDTRYVGRTMDQKNRLQELEGSLKIAQQRRDCARVAYINSTTPEWDRYMVYRKQCIEIEEKIEELF